jgi:acetolactate synthase I/II/III large subunit
MKVYDAVANAFVREGTSVVFGLLGDGQMTWWSALSQYPDVKIIDVREEGAALAMAEGWARANGKTGVCSVTQGPGLTRTVTSLIAATKSNTPLVVFTSRIPLNNDKHSQYLDQDRLVSATGAGYIEVPAASLAENAVRQAFYRARLESRPYVLCVPLNIQGQDCDSDGADYVTSATMLGEKQLLRPDLNRLREAVNIIAASRKPVLLLGRGAMDAGAKKAADRLGKRIGALITTSLIAKGALAESEYHAGISGLFASRAASQLFEHADCVIGAGASLNTYTLKGGYLYPNARVIQINTAPHLTMGDDHCADCYLQGDAELTLTAIDDMLAQDKVSQEGYRTSAVRKILRDGDRDPAEFEIEPGTVDPRVALRVFDEHLPPEVSVVTGIGHAALSFPIQFMTRARPLQLHQTAFGTIGQILSNAIGVAVALNQPVVAFEGDGSAMQNIQELDTAARLGIKLLYVVLNDEAYGMEYHKLRAVNLNGHLSVVPTPDFGAVGRVFGCRGRLARTLEEMTAAIDEFMAGDGTMVLDLRISRNVISIYQRRLEGQDV